MLSRLHQITLDLLKYIEIDQLLDALVNMTADFLDAPYAEIMLLENDTLIVQAATPNQKHLIGGRVGRGEAVLSWQAFDTHLPAVLRDYTNWEQHHRVYDDFTLHAVADFPVLNNELCIGVLAFGRDQPEYEFTKDQIQHGLLLANLTGLVLQNARLREALREQSIRDPLTGLFNRRYMEESLQQEISRVIRQLHPVSIIMLDIDHFKNFNDTFGHASGDMLLREFGKLLQSHVRAEDIACRYGGEEFILIMPHVTLEVALERAERLRQAAFEIHIHDGGQVYRNVTISLGAAVFPQHGKTIETVLKAADDALYRAKRAGRNRVMAAENEAK
jgi:diguanylate cyclase (GGDEF)-like protein